jgi:hypothetical protein
MKVLGVHISVLLSSATICPTPKTKPSESPSHWQIAAGTRGCRRDAINASKTTWETRPFLRAPSERRKK